MFMEPQIAIEIDGVYKKYAKDYKSIRKQYAKDFKNAIFNRKDDEIKLSKNEFWALNNVSFKVDKGETLGLIGLNGSGKSTLLKMINGILLPDHGDIKIEGEVGGLIELGAGFQPNLSGAENIYINGAVIGKSKEEMKSKFASIVEFSDLGDFIYAPIKNYSSGMKMRLGFSIAIHMKPEILLLDEVLAVGDFEFKQKCLAKINEIKKDTTTLFVSHSMGDIMTFCDRVIVLNKGKIIADDIPEKAIAIYQKEVKKIEPTKDTNTKPVYGDLYINEDKIYDIEHYWADKNLNKIDTASTWGFVNIIINFKLKTNPDKLIFGVAIWNDKGEYITSVTTDMNDIYFDSEKKEYSIRIEYEKISLNPGRYTPLVVIVDGLEYFYRDELDTFTIENSKRYFGFVTIPHKIYID